jgi:predicted nucleic acid-binding protein
MSGKKAFFDTDILIYAFASGDPRSGIAEGLLAAGGMVGVQGLNEFVSVATRKLAMPWGDVLKALAALRALCPPPAALTLAVHERALRIAGRYRYHVYDTLVIAAAIEASCSVLYTEDMHDGQVIDGLSIRNPFKSR